MLHTASSGFLIYFFFNFDATDVEDVSTHGEVKKQNKKQTQAAERWRALCPTPSQTPSTALCAGNNGLHPQWLMNANNVPVIQANL